MLQRVTAGRAAESCYQTPLDYFDIKLAERDIQVTFLLTSLPCASWSTDDAVPPLAVRIVGSDQHVSAGRPLRLECQALGSFPPAQLSWWRGHSRLRQVVREVSAYSVSRLWVQAGWDVAESDEVSVSSISRFQFSVHSVCVHFS